MQYWWRPILFASASLVYHAAPTLAFLPPSTFPSTTKSSVAELTPRIQSGYYYSQPTSRIIYSGDSTAIASTIQPLMECSNAVFNSAAYASSSFNIASGVFTTNNIKVAFNVATFFPQIPWLFLILLPNANITKKLMGGYGERGHMIFNVVSRGDDVHFLNTPPCIHTHTITEIVTICCLVHFFIVVSSIAQPDGTAPMAEFANVFDPSGDPQTAMVGMMQVSVGIKQKQKQIANDLTI